MTVIRPNSISGVTSITALANEINVFKHDGVLAGLQLNGVNHHTSSGVSTFHTLNVLGNVSVGGTLTYQDVTNVDSLGIGTFRTGVNVSGGQLDVGSNIKLGNAGVVTATSFVGSGANLTSLPTQITINNNSNGRILTGTGNANEVDAQASLFFTAGGDPKLTISGTGHAQLNLTSTSGTDHTGINFGDSADINAGMIQYSNTGNSMQFHTDGSEKLRIKSTGEVHISDRNSSNTGDHFFQAGAFGIRMEDTGGYNRWNIERNYGGFQSTPLVHLSAQGIIGINNPTPEGVGIDVTSSRSTAFSATADQRNLAHLVLRNSSDASGRFSSLSFVSGGGTQAEGSINLVQTGNYTGDMTFKMRNGSGSNDWVQAARFLSDGDFDFNKFLSLIHI